MICKRSIQPVQCVFLLANRGMETANESAPKAVETKRIDFVGVANGNISAQESIRTSKVFSDCVHGHIEIDPLCVAIIDTPQFQRLRHIKQLGGTCYVFPGAIHTRFEHSIGVCFLAGQMIETLKFKQPELKILDIDVKCVKIAGLCHDLGHGPYSHLFDGLFVPRALPADARKVPHEELSTLMFDHLLDMNCGIHLEDEERHFVKNLIHDQRTEAERKQAGDKAFLYEIIANKENGIDVDKWDYFARDCHQLGITNNFDYQRFLKFMRVIKVDGQNHVCFRDKEKSNVYNMFYTRNFLHRRAYQHATKQAVDFMLNDALLKADSHLQFTGINGKKKRMTTFGEDMVAFSKMTDHVYDQILNGGDKLKDAANILRRLEQRKLYRCLCETKPRTYSENGVKGFKITDEHKNKIVELSGREFTVDDFEILVVKFDYGMKEKNPVDSVRFYAKSKPDEIMETAPETLILPETFCEVVLRFFWKEADRAAVAQRAFLAWLGELEGWEHNRKRGHPQ